MTSEAGIDNKLFLVLWFRELEKQDLGRQVVYIRKPEAHQALLELVGDDL